MKFKKLFLILITFITASFYFTSCFNSLNDPAYPLVIPEFSPFTKYASLQGRISFEGAMPSMIMTSSGTGSQRTAMPEIESDWVYVLQASAEGQPAQTPVTVPVSSPTYFYPNLPTSQNGITWTVTVRLKKSATANDDTAIMVDECAISLTDDSAVYIHDFVVRPVSGAGTEGSLSLTMTVPESVTSVTVDPNNLGIVINTPATPNPPTGTPKTVNITGNLPAGSHSVRFNFYNSIGLLLYSNRQSINVFNGCETNTWVNNGGDGNSDPISSSGNYTVTDTMIANFQLNTFYIGSSALTSNSGTIAQGYTGSPAAPLSSFAEAVKIIKNRNNSSAAYNLLVRGSVTGNQVLGDSSNTSDCYIEGKAASITIMGARGLSNGLPQDQLNAGNSGTTLTINTSVPVKIENLLITGGSNTSGNGGGIYITNGNVELSNGTVVDGNSAKIGGGIYLYEGNLYLNGTAVVGKPISALGANPTRAGTTSGTYANKATQSGGGIEVYEGTLWLGYRPPAQGETGAQEVTNTTGGVIYNLVSGTVETHGGGIDNNHGTLKIAHGFVSYNYAFCESGYNKDGCGGGVTTADAMYLLGDATISHNESAYGGAVYISKGRDGRHGYFTMSGGSIESNASYKQNGKDGHGGGIAIGASGSFEMSGGTIKLNTAESRGGAIYHNGSLCKISGGTNCTATIPEGDGTNNIFLINNGQTITLEGSTGHTGTGEIAVTAQSASRGLTVLTGNGVADYYSKFKLTGVYGMGIKNTGKIDLDVIVTDIYINQSAAAANSFEPSANTKNDSTWNNSTYAFNASADSSQTKPFKKMDTALKFITYQASAQDYTIHIVGTYTVNSTDTQNIIANNTYTDNPIRLVKTATQTNPTVTATKITIAGVVDVDNPPKIVGGTFDGWPYSCVKIQTEVPVVFTNISIEGGRISNGGSGAGGINIDSSSAPRVSDVTLSTGTTVYNNRGYSIGAIQNYGTLKIAGATIKNNTHSNGLSGKGGAIYNAGGILYIYNNNTMIGQTEYSEPAKDEANKYSNYAITAGGAIYNENIVYNGTTYTGTIYIGKDADGNYSNPKISYNYARNGGAIYNSTGSEINFCQGEIVYNGTRATDGKGGGIYNEGILIFSDTGGKTKKIYRNSAVKGGAVYEGGSSAQLKMGTSGNNREVEIEWNDTGLSSYNNIYLDTKSGEDPCRITLTTTMSNMTSLRIDTAISTFTGKQIIEASGSANLADSVKYFKPIQPNPLPDLPYLINTDGKIAQLTGRANINAAAVGDIILDNGSIIPYSDDLDLDFKRNDAVAIVFNIDSSCSNDSSNRVLAFAVHDLGRNSKKWIDLENYHGITSNPFTELVVFTSGSSLSSYFSYWKDGSGNRAYARSHYPSSGVTLTTYPPAALDWCNNFGSVDPKCSTNYSTGWYLPSVTELKKIYENKTAVENSIRKVKTYSSYYLPYDYSYWSANAGGYEDSGYHFWAMSMSDGSFEEKHCKTGLYVLPIRQFN